jgi:hypothetical protein
MSTVTTASEQITPEVSAWPGADVVALLRLNYDRAIAASGSSIR